jgi:hypothetical protein
MSQNKIQVHKETYGHWPAKNGKPAGESFDLDLIDMSEPAQHAYRGMVPYRLSPEEKDKYPPCLIGHWRSRNASGI